MEAFATTATVVGLVGAAFTLFKEIRAAHHRVQGASKALTGISDQIQTLEASLKLVADLEPLQTTAIEQQIQSITKIAQELKTFLDTLVAEQEKMKIRRMMHALSAGDGEDKQLQDILSRLDRAQGDLTMRITATHVGLTGNQNEGFQVAFAVLQETNARVQQVLGINLALAEQLQAMSLSQTNGIVTLTAADFARLQADQEGSEHTIHDNSDRTYRNNIDQGKVRIMMQDIGMENTNASRGHKVAVTDNQFGNDAKIMMGNVGGEAAKNFFNSDFWK